MLREKNHRRVVALAVVVLASTAWVERAGATVIFSDDFSTSTLNGVSTATASSTSYDIASTKNQSPAASIGAGHLKMGMAATTSGVNQAQARFASAPVALVMAGDSIEYTLTFTNTAGLLAGGSASAINLGLYNSGGTVPAIGLQAAGLTGTSGSAFATGNAANWQGYTTRINGTGGNSQINTRPLQNGAGTTSANQDLVGNNAGAGLYSNPAGVLFGGNQASTVVLSAGTVYTDDLTITLNANGTLNFVSSLYEGAGTGGTVLFTENVNSTVATTITTSFDGLAFGWRTSGTSVATAIDVNSIAVSANIQTVPEPMGIGAVAVTLAGAMGWRRRR